MHKTSKFGENLLLREGSIQRALGKFAPIFELGIRQILKVDILRNNFIPFRFCIFFMMGKKEKLTDKFASEIPQLL